MAEGGPEWEAVIGMEVHAQLATRSKMFCACAAEYMGADPNTNVCEICLGMPGVLPVVNARAVELVIKSALALGCEIAHQTKFDRKNYFYPDLPKGYQISQYDLPIARQGRLELDGHTIGITRVHLEEDTGKLLHAGDALQTAEESLVDLNRSGLPLMEIVSEPDLRSAEQARDFAMTMRAILRAVGASEADMEKGQLRAEANVSVRRRGSDELGVKTEVKNLNSFRSLQRAVAHEISRQVQRLERGETVVQETRGWSESEQRTFSQRTKEYAQDYRYFPEPDLPPIELQPAWIEELRNQLPELPAGRRRRLGQQYGLGDYDAAQLTADLRQADLFEATVAAGAPTKPTANWIIGHSPSLPADQLAELVNLVVAGRISRDQGIEVLQQAEATGRRPEGIVRERRLERVSDEAALDAAIEGVLAENERAIVDFRAGKEAAINVLVGRVMAATRGAADAQRVKALLERRLKDGGTPAPPRK